VSRIGQEWTTGRVLNLNLSSGVNKEYADKIGVSTTPTFILFDPSGKELNRWVGTAPNASDLH
jgi:thioredoxin-related protein